MPSEMLPNLIRGLECLWTLLALIAATSSLHTWFDARREQGAVRLQLDYRPAGPRAILTEMVLRDATVKLCLALGFAAVGSVYLLTGLPTGSTAEIRSILLSLLLIGTDLSLAVESVLELRDRRRLAQLLANKEKHPHDSTQ